MITYTRCLVCDKKCRAETHNCTSEGKWINYYGRFEEWSPTLNKGVFIRLITLLKKKILKDKNIDLKSFQDFIPVNLSFSLGEGGTKIYSVSNYRADSKCRLYIKNEGSNPCHVYKDRESVVSINKCLRDGVRTVTLASTGNAAQSISVYANKVGIKTLLFISNKTSKEKVLTMLNNGSKLVIIKGSMEDAFKANRDLSKFLAKQNIRDCNPGIDWFRREGTKTIAYEMLAQLKTVPDWIIMPCGNGSSIRAVYKGFIEMFNARIIKKLPKMVGVQIAGGDPIPVGSYRKQITVPIEMLSPPKSFGDSAIASFDYIAAVKTILESGGCGVGVKDSEIATSLAEFINKEPIVIKDCIPEVVTAEILPAFEKLVDSNIIKKKEMVILFFSSHAVNDRENIHKLLSKYNYRSEWKAIEKLIPKIKQSSSLNNKTLLNSIQLVDNNPHAIKQAVHKLLSLS